jgi:toxin YhaV
VIGSPAGLGERHGWKLFRARAFREAMTPLQAEVERLELQSGDRRKTHPKAKLLARIVSLITEEIPRDPHSPIFALGNTLGPAHRHWRRAKFLQRFRLFFRFDSASRIIVYAWMNDENQLRKAGSREDPYAVFSRRLKAGNPPDDWEELLADASEAEGGQRNP